MLKNFKRFTEENLDGQELEKFMAEMNQSLNELTSGNAVKEEVQEFIHSLLQTQDKEGFWSITPSPNVDGDFRVDYWYTPTYIASAYLMYYYLQLHSDAQHRVEVEAALIKGLQASTMRGLNGHGYDGICGRIKAVEVFKKGNVIKFLEQHPHLCANFTTLIFSVIEGFRNALATGETKGAWGEEYKESMGKAVSGFQQDEGTLIFVYGTLLKGRSNHQRFLSTALFLGEGVVVGYTLHDLGFYPGIKRSKKGVVKGEVYKVDAQTLVQIDMLEGEGSLYIRETASVICDSQRLHNVNIYIYNKCAPKNKSVPFEAQPWGKAQ